MVVTWSRQLCHQEFPTANAHFKLLCFTW